jgi:hypothetical protein
MCLIFLVTAAIIAAIVMKIAGVGEDKVKLPGPNDVRLPFTLRSQFLKSNPNKFPLLVGMFITIVECWNVC